MDVRKSKSKIYSWMFKLNLIRNGFSYGLVMGYTAVDFSIATLTI